MHGVEGVKNVVWFESWYFPGPGGARISLSISLTFTHKFAMSGSVNDSMKRRHLGAPTGHVCVTMRAARFKLLVNIHGFLGRYSMRSPHLATTDAEYCASAAVTCTRVSSINSMQLEAAQST